MKNMQPPPRKTIDIETMNPPLFFFVWAIYLAHIYAMSTIVGVANMVAMMFFMHMNFTDFFLNGH